MLFLFFILFGCVNQKDLSFENKVKLADSFYSDINRMALDAEWGNEDPSKNPHIIDLNNYLNSKVIRYNSDLKVVQYDKMVTFNEGKSIYSLTVDALSDKHDGLLAYIFEGVYKINNKNECRVVQHLFLYA